MVLPYEVPLNEAHHFLRSGNVPDAEKAIERFFANLESDEMVREIRRQHTERQIFEADLLGVLTRQEIDAWAILAACHIAREQLDAARDACYRQLELLDHFYGFELPSWKDIETRVPPHEELVPRYVLAADLLSQIFAMQNQNDLSARWDRVKGSALSDRKHPEAVWERWISAGEEVPTGRNWFELVNWTINLENVDGHRWLVQLDTRLGTQLSPHEFPWLLTINIPTSQDAEIPGRSVLWSIWGFRQAVNSALLRAGAGALAIEAQRRGQRKIIYYVADAGLARNVIEPIMKAAQELQPQYELKEDRGWDEYVKWGGKPLILDKGSSAPLPETGGAKERIEDAIFRAAWKITESTHDVWSRFYNQTWLINRIPPSDASVKKHCLDQLFQLVDNLRGSYKVKGLIQLVWKLPAVDRDAAIRAYNELLSGSHKITEEFYSELSLAVDALRQIDPRRALEMTKYLKDCSLVTKSLAGIAGDLAAGDRKLALSTAEKALKLIRSGKAEPYFKAEDMLALVQEISEIAPDLSKKLLTEALSFACSVDEATDRFKQLLALCNQVQKTAPDMLEKFCKKAIETAVVLEKEGEDWMEHTGPFVSGKALAAIAVLVASYDRRAAAQLMAQALNLSCREGDSWEHLELISDLAVAVRDGKLAAGTDFDVDLWDYFISSMPEIVNVPDPYIFASQVTLRFGLKDSIEAFVSMNPTLAAQRFDGIFKICAAAALPEMEVKLLCAFARCLGKANIHVGDKLLERACKRYVDCSSSYLKAVCLAQISAAKASLGQDPIDWWENLLAQFRSVPGESRYEAVLEVAALLNTADEKLARKLLQALDTMSDDTTIVAASAISRLTEMPVRVSGELMLRWLLFVPPAEFIGSLCQWANKFAEKNQRSELESVGAGTATPTR
jgi:hypothetical protein